VPQVQGPAHAEAAQPPTAGLLQAPPQAAEVQAGAECLLHDTGRR